MPTVRVRKMGRPKRAVFVYTVNESKEDVSSLKRFQLNHLKKSQLHLTIVIGFFTAICLSVLQNGDKRTENGR